MKYRLLQRITGVDRIHHIYYGYGYKLPLLDYGYFIKYGIRKLGTTLDKDGETMKAYHNRRLLARTKRT